MRNVVRLLAVAIVLASIPAQGEEPVRPVLVGIYTGDYESTVSWYGRNFDFETTKEVVNEAANIRIGFLDNGAFELEIFADIEPDPEAVAPARNRFGMPGAGFVKLSVATDELSALAARLAANDVQFVREINESDRKPGFSWFMVQDPDGNLVQVFGPSPAVDSTGNAGS